MAPRSSSTRSCPQRLHPDRLVLAAPWLQLAMKVPRWKLSLGALTSRFWPTLALANGIRAEDVSRNPEVLANFWKDPLVHHVATARWFAEATAAQRRILGAAASWACRRCCWWPGPTASWSTTRPVAWPRRHLASSASGVSMVSFTNCSSSPSGPRWSPRSGISSVRMPPSEAQSPGPVRRNFRLYFLHEREPPRRLPRKRARAPGVRAGPGASGAVFAHARAGQRLGSGLRSGRRRAAAEAAPLRGQRGRLLQPGPRPARRRPHRPRGPGRGRARRRPTTPIRSASAGGCSVRWAWPRRSLRCANACWPACPTSSAATSAAARPASTSSTCSWPSCTTPACWRSMAADPAPVGRALRESLAFVDRLLAGVGRARRCDGACSPPTAAAWSPAPTAARCSSCPSPGITDCTVCRQRNAARQLDDDGRRISHEALRAVVVEADNTAPLRPGWTLVPAHGGLLVGADRVPHLDPACVGSAAALRRGEGLPAARRGLYAPSALRPCSVGLGIRADAEQASTRRP